MEQPRPTCPGCARPLRECWVLPCLYLEQVMEQGKPAVRELLEARGYVVTETERGDLLCDL